MMWPGRKHGMGMAQGRNAGELVGVNSVGGGENSCRTRRWDLVSEPANQSQCLGDPFGERGHLPLQVDEEGV